LTSRPCGSPSNYSSKVGVNAAIVFVSLQILPLNQGLHTLLDEGRHCVEALMKLARDLRNKLIVVEHLARFHDAHNGGFHQMPPVFFDSSWKFIAY